MDAERQLIATVYPSAAEIDAADWNRCASGSGAERPANPFLEHDFFVALEASGSATARTGWAPQHIVLRETTGQVAGLMPAYLKSHSRGEYVFDWGWADAFERAGGRYYPKLQISVPFTPVPAPKLLARDHRDEAVKRALTEAAERLALERGASSAHATFLPEAEQAMMAEAGWLPRLDRQFHWENAGYASFADFLGSLTARKRKAIRRERRGAVADGLDIEQVTGEAITERHWDAMYGFYMDTGARKWGRPYLNREFFSRLGATMPDRVLLVLARQDDRYVAGALNLIGDDALYGRYWGASGHFPFLHFELCYYQAIDFAIERGLSRVEAGAQGEHKLARGYLPCTTYSAHWIAHEGLRSAVAEHLDFERAEVDRDQAILARYAPFREVEEGD